MEMYYKLFTIYFKANDMDKVIKLLTQSAKIPLSVIIIGIGFE